MSIIIPAYDVAPYIAETLASVLNQTYPSWEAIVVNDGSTDTSELEAALLPFRDRITYISQPNRGAGAARNSGIAVARGEWLAFLDGDDYWMQNNLECQLAQLVTRQLDMVWSGGLVIGATVLAGKPITYLGKCRGEITLDSLILGRVHVPNSGTIVRRRCVTAIGGLDETLRRGQDFDLWVRLLNSGVRAGYHGAQLLRYRVRPGNLSGDILAQVDRELKVLNRLRDKRILPAAQAQTIERRLVELQAIEASTRGKRQLAARQYAAASSLFKHSLRLQPTAKMRAIVWLLPLMAPCLRWLSLARTPKEFR